MSRIREVLSQALELPTKQRARVAHELLLSLEEEPLESPAAVAKAWDVEIARRVEDLRTGRVKAVPLPEVRKDVERALRAVRGRRARGR